MGFEVSLEPDRLRGMVSDGKSNLSIALSLGVSIKKVIVAVRELEIEDRREELKAPFDYAPTGMPDRKYRSWTTGERAAVLTSEATLDRMADKLGRTYGAVKTQRSTLRKYGSVN